ncbi:MAG: hypothetical protein ABSC92_02085 [Rhizomicrobium sp.]|jgi:hypothetical protein
MSKLKKREHVAVEAVAKHFFARWEEGEDASCAAFSIAGKRIAVEIATAKPRITDLTKPRLRFDKVVTRVTTRLQAALRDSIPDGTTVIVTIAAPILNPSKTAEAIEDKIRMCLARRSAEKQYKEVVHGNRIRIGLVKSRSGQVSKVIGLVHNPDSNPDTLLQMTQSLLQHIGAAADGRTPAKSARERWLVIIAGGGFIETYRQIYAQFSVQTDFTKILMVFGGDRVETLTG